MSEIDGYTVLGKASGSNGASIASQGSATVQATFDAIAGTDSIIIVDCHGGYVGAHEYSASLSGGKITAKATVYNLMNSTKLCYVFFEVLCLKRIS